MTRMRFSRRVVSFVARHAAWPAVVAAVCGVSPASAAAGQEQQRPPTFRTSVDLVRVDVSVVGNDGKPVTGLSAGDFSLSVDGRPRTITSAEFVSLVRESKPVSSPTAVRYSTNTSGAGRLIMFVVDQGSIGHGRGRAVMESASRFISQLSPNDRIGLLALPTGPRIDFTGDHGQVQAALPQLVGQAETFPTTYRIGVSEAMAIQRGDRTALNTLISRECDSARSPEELDFCRTRIVADVNGLAGLIRERTQTSVGTLRSLAERFARLPGPKALVFFSEGLVLESAADVTSLADVATRGQMTVHVMQLDAPTADASLVMEPASPGADRALAREGLEMLAGVTRGGVFRIVAGADNAFSRLGLELSGYYLLGFEAEPSEKDGRPHKIKVSVPGRSGLEIRARSEFSADVNRVKTDDALLAETLEAPLLATDIGLKLTTFTFREPAGDKARILMVVELDRAADPDSHIALAYKLSTDRNRLLASQIDRDVKATINPATKVQTFTTFVTSDIGARHILKVAVLDDRGRRGSVEHTFEPKFVELGDVTIADLLLADQRSSGGSATPAIGGEFTSGMVHGYLELYAGSADVLKNTTVIFEVAADEAARAIDGAAGKVQPSSAESPDRRAVEGTIPTTLLPPGNYVLRAVISTDGQKLGHVARPFTVGRVSADASTAANGMTLRSPSMRAAAVPFTSKTERFERASVLTPEVVGFFMERLNFTQRGESSPESTIDHARAGRFEEAVRALTSRTGTVPSTFLSGLALYAKGELEPAAAKFRETLRLDSEFFPAAFYLGSCYAAGGRDQEAIGAWQLSLVTESDAPFIYTLLGDALLRERDIEQALQVLNEAAGVWPDDEQVQVRIGAAYAMSGKRVEALDRLAPYLERHPDDFERHFVALRTLYEARAARQPIRSADEDRALFEKWSAAYAAAKGPQQALVDQWQRSFRR